MMRIEIHSIGLSVIAGVSIGVKRVSFELSLGGICWVLRRTLHGLRLVRGRRLVMTAMIRMWMHRGMSCLSFNYDKNLQFKNNKIKSTILRREFKLKS